MASSSATAATDAATIGGQSIWSRFSRRKPHGCMWPTSEKESAAAEARLLSRIRGFVPAGASEPADKDAPLRASVRQVSIGSNEYINTLSITSKNQDEETDTTQSNTLVIAHGYGAGLGYFYRNLELIASNRPGWTVHAIDWLGMGRSARVPFPKRKKKTESEYVDAAEDFFIDSLERWRKIQGIERMTLAGHSLGGYLSTVYALRYPERVERLILISPVGIPEQPTEDEHTGALNEASTGLGSEVAASDAEAIAQAESDEQVDGSLDNIDLKDAAAQIPAPVNEFGQSPSTNRRRKLPGWVTTAWDRNYTPQWFIRVAGPFGPRLVRSYVQNRMYHLSEEERRDLQHYTYHISSASGSGEYSLSALLAPGAHARRPLRDRLPGLKMPTTFIYGDRDWMDYRHAVAVQPRMSVETEVVRVFDGGHHMYLENPNEFSRVMVEEMIKAERRQQTESNQVPPLP